MFPPLLGKRNLIIVLREIHNLEKLRLCSSVSGPVTSVLDPSNKLPTSLLAQYNKMLPTSAPNMHRKFPAQLYTRRNFICCWRYTPPPTIGSSRLCDFCSGVEFSTLHKGLCFFKFLQHNCVCDGPFEISTSRTLPGACRLGNLTPDNNMNEESESWKWREHYCSHGLRYPLPSRQFALPFYENAPVHIVTITVASTLALCWGVSGSALGSDIVKCSLFPSALHKD